MLPYIPEGKTPQPLPVFHHVGVYAYRPEALAHYTQWGEGSLEANEGLEQLRFLENAEKIMCVEVRSAERRVGKEGVRTCRSRWSPFTSQKKTSTNTRHQMMKTV